MNKPASLLAVLLLTAASAACDDSSETPVSSADAGIHDVSDASDAPDAFLPPQPVCGNGILDQVTEECDGMDNVPETCADFDPSREWAEGGSPACAPDCSSLVQGTCEELFCGDGEASARGEVCDGTDGVPPTCADFDPAKRWDSEGAPACSDDCSQVTKGTCREWVDRSITFVNWNVQVDYASWGGKLVPPRAAKLKELVEGWRTSWSEMPAAIAIVEVSPSWHAPETTAIFNSLGYYWADEDVPIKDKWNGFDCGENNENVTFDLESGQEDPAAASCYLLTSMLYRKDAFDVVDADYVKLLPAWNASGPFVNNKVTAFCAVLKEKATSQEFLVCSTHWLANNGAKPDQGIAEIAGPILENERKRITGAHIAADFVKSMREKHPQAHVFFGGDFNTIDMNIIFESELASMVLGSDWETLAKRINLLLVGSDYTPVDENFRTSHAVFWSESGLEDARTEAIRQGLVTDINGESGDVKTSSDPGIPEFLKNMNVPVVIDYAFHSTGMELTSYEVVMDSLGSYEFVSDHYPVRTSYKFEALMP